MPVEIRRIILSEEELKRALNSYRRMTKGFLPDGDFEQVEVKNDGTLNVKIGMNYSGQEKMADFEVTSDHACDILIRFCVENNIPIPREGTKKPIEAAGRLVLQIRLSDLEEERAEAALAASSPPAKDAGPAKQMAAKKPAAPKQEPAPETAAKASA